MAMFIRDIPPDILFKLYNMLDIQGQRMNWRELGEFGASAGFCMDDIQSFGRAQFSGGSPSEQLMRVWGYRNIRVTELYENLAMMGHGQAMKLIKHLVDPKLHYMIDNIVEGKPLEINPADRRHQAPLPGANYMPASRLSGPPPPDNAMQMAPGFPQPNMKYQDHYRMDNQHSAKPANFYPSSQHSQRYMVGSNRLSPGQNHMPLRPNQPLNHPDSRLYVPGPSSPFMHQPQDSPALSADISREEREQLVNIAATTTTIHKDYEDIKRATNNFDEAYKLGEGSFGKVYLANINQTKYAVKVLLQNDKLQVAFHNNHRSDQSKELKALAQYKHTNIVLMCFFSVDGENPCIIYEYLENGSLEDNLLGKGGRKPLSWERRHQIAEGAALGINHLHKASKTTPLIHGDIKSANILLDKYFEPKIADFGLARPGPTDGKSHTFLRTQFAHGTLPYLPEEFKRNLQLSTKVDSFSFGVVLMEMLTGERAYDDRREPHQLLSSYIIFVTENKTMSIKQLKDKKCPDWPDKAFEEMLMLSKRLVGKYKHRPEMEQVLSCLKAISSGKGSQDVSDGAGRAENRADSLSSLESLDTGKKQENAASRLTPAKDNRMDKLENVKDEDNSKLTEEEKQRKQSIEDFNRKVELLSLEVQNDQGNHHPRHSPTVGREREYYYGKEHPPGVADQLFFPGGSHMHHGQLSQMGGPAQMGGPGQMGGPAQMGRDYQRTLEGSGGRHFPETYHSQISPQSRFKQHGCYSEAGKVPGVSETTLSSQYQGNSSTSDSSNSPYSYTQRYLGGKETAVDRAFYEGYQLGFQRGFQEAVLQQMQLRGMQEGREDAGRLYRPDQTIPTREAGHVHSQGHFIPAQVGPLSSLHHAPAMSHVSPGVNFSYAATPELKHLASMDPHTNNRTNPPRTDNKTDDAKITTSGEKLSETNSHEKSVSALQTKPISLHELRYQKEPQQSTEPM